MEEEIQMNELKIIEPEIKDLQLSSSDMVAHAEMLVVRDDSTFASGGEMLLDIKRIGKTVEARFKEPVDLAFKAHRSLTALRDSVLAPFQQAEKIIKRKIGDYQYEIERKRQEEATRLRRQAEAQAEADRIAKAQAQMDAGDLKGCEKTLEAPIAPVVVKVETPEPPKVAGLSFREEWKYEVIDPNLVPREYLMIDESKLRKVVKALGKAAANIPGIRVYPEKVVSAGRAA
jgi:hypothetical protein